MYLSAGAVCRLLKIPHRTLADWVAAGIVRPAIPGVGSGNHRQFLLVPDVLVITLGRGLRAHGLTREAAGNAMERVRQWSEEELTAEFARGKTILTMVGAEATDRLLAPAQIAGSRLLRGAHEAGAPILLIDLARLYQNMTERIEREEEEATA